MINTYNNGTLVEAYDDRNDGTATLTDYTTDPPVVTEITGLPVLEILPDPPAPELIAAQAISEEISSRIALAETVTELRVAISEGLSAAIISLGGQQ